MKFLKNLLKGQSQKSVEEVIPEPEPVVEEPEEPVELPDEIKVSWVECKEIFHIEKNLEKMGNDLKEMIYGLEQRKMFIFGAMKEASQKRQELIAKLQDEKGITDSEHDFTYIPAQEPNTASKFIKKQKK